MLPLIPLVVGAAIGGLAVYVASDDNTRVKITESIDNLKEKILGKENTALEAEEPKEEDKGSA